MTQLSHPIKVDGGSFAEAYVVGDTIGLLPFGSERLARFNTAGTPTRTEDVDVDGTIQQHDFVEGELPLPTEFGQQVEITALGPNNLYFEPTLVGTDTFLAIAAGTSVSLVSDDATRWRIDTSGGITGAASGGGDLTQTQIQNLIDASIDFEAAGLFA